MKTNTHPTLPMLKLEDLNVLAVEPSSTQRRIIVGALESAGINHIEEVTDGASALREMVNQSPDLIISSLYLPDMTGTELITHIRTSESHEQTAFMLISSETRLRYLDPIRQAGAIGILPKPFSQQELQLALNSTLDLIDSEHLSLDEEGAASLRVLVVDDSALSRKHVCQILTLMDIDIDNIDTAENGQQALELINSEYYDFVVSDYNMPVMDGMELIDQIRNHSNQGSLPVLMVTSETDQNRLAAVQQAGVSAICDKPFEPALVHKLIKQVLTH